MRIDLEQIEPALLEQCARVIREGGVVLYPTDTIYGLGCDPFQAAAVDRLSRIKGRPEENGMLVIAPERSWVERLADDLPDNWSDLADRFWPGPLTLVLKAAPELPDSLVGSRRTIGVRIPDHHFLQQWMKRIPGPIVSTSANRSGHPYRGDLRQLVKDFSNSVDLFLDAGDPGEHPPSTVVDLSRRPWSIVRHGAGAEEVSAALESTEEDG